MNKIMRNIGVAVLPVVLGAQPRAGVGWVRTWPRDDGWLGRSRDDGLWRLEQWRLDDDASGRADFCGTSGVSF